MRWLFADPDDEREARRREGVVKLIDRWWEAFRDRQHDLEAFFTSSSNWDLAGWMQDHLQAIDPNLMWEFGPALQQRGHRLVITPETQRQLRPLINFILSRAPALNGWELYGYRPAEELSDVIETVRALCGGDVSQSMVHARHDGHHRIAISYYCPECPEHTDLASDQVQMAAFVATESSLGEALLDRWIGTIDVHPLLSDKPRGERSRAIPFARLQPTVEAIIGSLLDQLPKQPCYQSAGRACWSSYELQPPEGMDFPGRTDLCVAISSRRDVFEALHGGSPFYSDVHSRCGETFCYLKIDGGSEPMSVRSQLRSQIEEAVDQSLIPRQLGCVIGGGTGVRYSYVDLALTDVHRAWHALRHLGERGLFAPRSWLLFCDAELAEEWLPLVATAPPPPTSCPGNC
jgi:hypothetical protein